MVGLNRSTSPLDEDCAYLIDAEAGFGQKLHLLLSISCLLADVNECGKRDSRAQDPWWRMNELEINGRGYLPDGNAIVSGPAEQLEDRIKDARRTTNRAHQHCFVQRLAAWKDSD